MMAPRLTSPIFTLALGAMVLGGCNRPVWEKKSEERGARVHNKLSRYAKHDADGSERMEKTFNLMSQRRGYHEEHLEKTSSLVRKEMESDSRRWSEERPKRRAFARRQWCGNPDTIPGTWAKMVY